MPLLLFHRGLLPPGDRESARDLGIALMDRFKRIPPPMQLRQGQLALPRLQAAVRADPDDLDALDAKARAHWAVGEISAAAAAFDDVLTRSPRREVTLSLAAALAIERARWETAVSYLDRAIVVNPWRHELRLALGEAHAALADWPAAFTAGRDAVRLNPAGWQGRKLLVACYLATGKPDEARAEFQRLLALHPPDEESLRRWFAQQSQ